MSFAFGIGIGTQNFMAHAFERGGDSAPETAEADDEDGFS